ncbi:MAG TPA: prepilin-type N-terminal cleavage/methylation domain-containing protein [Steroidobacteraceae bacterium]|nr:prepilin-type N-terminal cleavage/methylation domain-containing protein [Steroidobacteraceae bacterium]
MNGRAGRGFTLIEMMVVMVIISLLLTIAVPRYLHALARSKETVLKQDLAALRESIDKFYGDTGKFPETLATLVEKRYLRSIPVDPIAKSAEKWVVILDDEPEDNGVKDVHSGAEGSGQNGVPYVRW